MPSARAGHVRGPLHGIPLLIKDNIEVAGAVATTAGSLALKDNIPAHDAPVIARLRKAGAIILGKTNLSEWANIRSSASVSGWSAVGGLTHSPYALDRNACGSSSGTGSGVSASLAAAGVGTETDGSVTCPSSVAGLVGIKPTIGLISRTGIVPISHSQDTAGPMGRSVKDVALLLTAMAGSDPADPVTKAADEHKTDYTAALQAGALKGRRFVVLRFLAGDNVYLDAQLDAAVDVLHAAGAETVEVKTFDGLDAINADELTVMLTELKVDLNAYLAKTPASVKTRTLADVIAFNKATPPETVLFGQDLFEKSEATKGLDDPAYKKARAKNLRMAGVQGIDKLLKANKADALVGPTLGPTWVNDVVAGDHVVAGASTTLPAIAGYPHITVPIGQREGSARRPLVHWNGVVGVSAVGFRLRLRECDPRPQGARLSRPQRRPAGAQGCPQPGDRNSLVQRRQRLSSHVRHAAT